MFLSIRLWYVANCSVVELYEYSFPQKHKLFSETIVNSWKHAKTVEKCLKTVFKSGKFLGHFLCENLYNLAQYFFLSLMEVWTEN